jgi:5-methyltetrahydropteroyltriglutamate--homocysteine methyltransferase
MTLKPPFRADHVGSLLRPKRLLQARADHAAGKLAAADLKAMEDAAIAGVVKMQEDVGLNSVTDGEFRRLDWVMDFKYQLDGVIKHEGEIVRVPFQTDKGPLDWTFVPYTISSRIKLKHVIYGEGFTFLRNVTKQTAKLTIPSPSMMHYPGGRGLDRKVYPDLEEFFQDVAGAYRAEVAGLAKLGCTYLQFDDTSLAFLNSAERRRAVGPDGEKQHLRYIQLINESLADKPAGMTVTTHLCRGNFRSAWIPGTEASYDYVAEALFGSLNVDGFFLEYDDQRSGGFEPLRFVPKGKRVVLGLITTKRPELESKDDLKRRIDEAAKYVPLDQLCLSPQCGFSSTSEGNELTDEQQGAKLRLVVETAHEVWGSA